MALRSKLDDIIDGLESQSFESYSFLNKKTGQVILITEEEMRAVEDGEPIEDFPQWQQDSVKIAKEIDETDNYIQLPAKFDIDEHRIMERFCLSIDDAKMRNLFCNLIRDRGAFRHFKDAIYEHDISDDWFEYRNNALKHIAIEWCEENDIEFDDK